MSDGTSNPEDTLAAEGREYADFLKSEGVHGYTVVKDLASAVCWLTARVAELERPPEAQASPSSNERSMDDLLRDCWRAAGGDFHGPNVETCTMPEAKLLPYLGGLYQQISDLRHELERRHPSEATEPRCENCQEILPAHVSCNYCGHPQRPHEPLKTCGWAYDGDGYWQTDCGQAFVLNDGNPADNEMNFCHHCGKPIGGASVTKEGPCLFDRLVGNPLDMLKTGCDHDFAFTENKDHGWCVKCKTEYDYAKHGIV